MRVDLNGQFVSTTTYLGIIEAYIHPAQGGSGCFKARTNGSVGWVELGSGPTEQRLAPSFCFQPPCGELLSTS